MHREEMSEVRLNVGKQHHVVVIGAGFAGLSAACSLAKEGFKVTVLDKQPEVGGRCRVWEKDGFKFDMGPSWYWMPDVFDEFFARFGKKTSDYYRLRRLDPPYRLFMENGRPLDIPDRVQALEDLFESTQPGCRGQFRKFMAQAEYKYKVAMGDYVRRPSLALSEFIDVRMLREVMRLDMLSSQSSHVKGFFKHPDLVKIMEWPVLFLGGAPSSVPAMYSMMNYASVVLGTHYPDGGMVQVPLAMRRVAEELGVEFKLGERFNVDRICCEGGKATGVEAKGESPCTTCRCPLPDTLYSLLQPQDKKMSKLTNLKRHCIFIHPHSANSKPRASALCESADPPNTQQSQTRRPRRFLRIRLCGGDG